MKILIEKIMILGRVRKELTKIDELAEDIRINGLLHPVIVMPLDIGQFRLLAGLRRLKAVEKLGETKIDVKTVSPANAEAELRIEISENEQRGLSTFSKKMDYASLIEEIEQIKAKERMSPGGKHGKDKEGSGCRRYLDGKKSSDVVGEKVGMSGRQYERAKHIVKNAPEDVIDELDSGKRSITGTYNELRAKEKAKKTLELSVSETAAPDDKPDSDYNEDEDSEDNPEDDVNSQPDEVPKRSVAPSSLLSKADEEAIARNKAFNALSPQKKVVELQRQLKEERARAARAESELERLKELRHNDIFHKDGIITNLRERLEEAESRVKELEDLYGAGEKA